MLTWLYQTWRALTTSTRTALLEAENARLASTNEALEDENAALRGEVRALVNTALGQAGMAPLPPLTETPKPAASRVRVFSRYQERRINAVAAAREQAQLRDELIAKANTRIAAGK